MYILYWPPIRILHKKVDFILNQRYQYFIMSCGTSCIQNIYY